MTKNYNDLGVEFKYLIVNDMDQKYGLWVNTVGFQSIQPNSPYPLKDHPTGYFFNAQKGRILREYQLVYITKGRGVFSSETTPEKQVCKGRLMVLFPGQWQRISIARAILKDAPIVVFDEGTSYSDIENEHKIQLALQNLLRGKTTIMIAHRLHTIRNADKIFVFQDGKVVEQGTHDELIASGSTYSHMWDTYTRETIGEE